MAYDAFTALAASVNGAAKSGAGVVNDVVATAANDTVVSAAILSGAGYYAYRKRKA